MKFVLATVYICLAGSGSNICESHKVKIENCETRKYNAQVFSEDEKVWKSAHVGIKCGK